LGTPLTPSKPYSLEKTPFIKEVPATGTDHKSKFGPTAKQINQNRAMLDTQSQLDPKFARRS